jgi:hypothetical protein
MVAVITTRSQKNQSYYKDHSCGPPEHLPAKDTYLGLDLVAFEIELVIFIPGPLVHKLFTESFPADLFHQSYYSRGEIFISGFIDFPVDVEGNYILGAFFYFLVSPEGEIPSADPAIFSFFKVDRPAMAFFKLVGLTGVIRDILIL